MKSKRLGKEFEKGWLGEQIKGKMRVGTTRGFEGGPALWYRRRQHLPQSL